MQESSKKRNLEDRIVNLASALLEGKISGEGIVKLETLLIDNPEAIDIYNSFINLHLALGDAKWDKDGALVPGGSATVPFSPDLFENLHETAPPDSAGTMPPIQMPNDVGTIANQGIGYTPNLEYRGWNTGTLFSHLVWALVVFTAVVAGSMVSAVVLASVTYRAPVAFTSEELKQLQELQQVKANSDNLVAEKDEPKQAEYYGPDLWWEDDFSGTFEPTALPITEGLVVHLDASSGVFADTSGTPAKDGDMVQVWEDSKREFRVSQEQPQKGPIWISQGLQVGENRFAPVLRFSGRQYLHADNLVPTIQGQDKPISVLAVVKFLPSVSFDRQHILGFGKVGDTATLYVLALTAQKDYYRPSNALFCNRRDEDRTECLSIGSKNSVELGVFHICSLVDSGTEGSVYLDGVAQCENADFACKPIGVDRALVGGLPYGGEFHEKTSLYGEIAALIVFDRNISKSERQTLENYLSRRYALPIR